MKYLRNPITHAVRTASALEAKSLRRYGWEYVKREAWIEYQRAQVQAALAKHVRLARPVFGRVQ